MSAPSDAETMTTGIDGVVDVVVICVPVPSSTTISALPPAKATVAALVAKVTPPPRSQRTASPVWLPPASEPAPQYCGVAGLVRASPSGCEEPSAALAGDRAFDTAAAAAYVAGLPLANVIVAAVLTNP